MFCLFVCFVSAFLLLFVWFGFVIVLLFLTEVVFNIGFLGGPVWRRQELDSGILVGPFQSRTFYDSNVMAFGEN